MVWDFKRILLVSFWIFGEFLVNFCLETGKKKKKNEKIFFNWKNEKFEKKMILRKKIIESVFSEIIFL